MATKKKTGRPAAVVRIELREPMPGDRVRISLTRDVHFSDLGVAAAVFNDLAKVAMDPATTGERVG